MKKFNADAQSKFMVKNAKYTMLLGFFMLILEIYPIFKILVESAWIQVIVSLILVIGLIYIAAILASNYRKGPSSISEMLAGYRDEYTYKLDRTGQSWAFNGIIIVLLIQMIFIESVNIGFSSSQIATINLALCFFIYGAKITWEITKEAMHEKSYGE